MNGPRFFRKVSARPVLLVVLLAGCATAPDVERVGVEYPAIDLVRVPDGTFRGSAVERGFTYEVATTVQGHRLVEITVLNNKNSRHGRKAMGVIPLILAQQKADVDGVSGATYCSTGLKRAVADSLVKAVR